MGYTMLNNKFSLVLSLMAATFMTACGGGSGGGDADNHVVRNLFAVGDVFEATEDGGAIQGDVSKNEKGKDLTFALASGSNTLNGTLVFNADGTFSYTPKPDFYGTDSFSYVATQTTTGDTDTALVTIKVVNDFEELEEYGWGLVWKDEFESPMVDANLWQGTGGNVADGKLLITAEEGITSSLKAVKEITYGRIEAGIQVPAGSGLSTLFGLMPVADRYAGRNELIALDAKSDEVTAGAHYGLGLVNGVAFNAKTKSSATTEFHIYALEWDEKQIRWYLDGVHVHTVNTLNTWAYSMAGDQVLVDQSGPFNQPMQVVFELSNTGGASSSSLLVDYVKVWQCDPSVSPEIKACASRASSALNKAASDRIESIGAVTTHLYKDGFTPLQWHYTDTTTELKLAKWNEPSTTELAVEGRGIVLDVSHPAGDSNISISAPGVELVGHEAVLTFDMYIDSAETTTETIDVRMETGWPYLGLLVWKLEELELDKWVSYSIPVSDFIDSPFLAPDWLNWIPGVSQGDPLPLNTHDVNSLLTLESHGAVHFQINNIQLRCTSSESCIQGPLAIQPEVKNGPAPIRYEAEAYTAESGTQLEATEDEGGGENVGWVDAGDFLEYTITAPTAGRYSLDYRLASQGGSAGFEVTIDGVLIDTQTVKDTGGWQNWATQSSAVFDLDAGSHVLRINFLGGSINFNWFELFPPAFEILLQAEDYKAGGDVQLEDTEDEGGGQNVGWIDAGDFLEYSITVPADGTYFIEYRLATQGGSAGFETSFAGVKKDAQAVTDTGGWQNWSSQTATVELQAGEQTLRLDFLGGAININWIKLTN